MQSRSRFRLRQLLSLVSSLAFGACGDDSDAGDGFIVRDYAADASVALDATQTNVSPIFTPGLYDATLSGDASSTSDASSGDANAPTDSGSGNTGIGLEGTGYTPFATNGKPIDAADGKWTYTEFPDAWCRDGSQAGINIFRNKASKKVFFFFEGGGACFDDFTCGANPKAVDDNDKTGPGKGVFDRSNAANPLKDWNIVYVPYCTGDIFGGTNPNGFELQGKAQKFVGYLNSQAFLQRVVPTFADATDVLVTGVSAGGFGASVNVVLIQRAFQNVKVKLIDDSGPPMSNKVVAPCLAKKWRESWGLDKSVLVDCGVACSADPDNFSFDYGVHLSKVFSNRLSGLIETTGDDVISSFFGLGAKNLFGEECKGTFGLTAIPDKDFEAGLIEFRNAVKDNPGFGTYFPTGGTHTILMGDGFYTSTVGGVKLSDWVSDIVNDKGTKHVGP